MECKKEIFTDGIGQIHFTGGMVRYDYVTFQPAGEGEAAGTESSIRIIMPPQGFLEAYNAMNQMVEKMIEAGVFKKSKPARKSTKKK